MKKTIKLHDKSEIFDMNGEYVRIYPTGKIEGFESAQVFNIKGRRGKFIDNIKGLRVIDGEENQKA